MNPLIRCFVVALALGACKSAAPGHGATAVRLGVTYDDGWGLDALEVSARDRSETVTARHEVLLLVPDDWEPPGANEALAIEVWGLRGNEARAAPHANPVRAPHACPAEPRSGSGPVKRPAPLLDRERLREREKGRVVVGEKLADGVAARTQKRLDIARGAVASTNPHDLGRVAVQEAPLVEVGVLGNDRQVLARSVDPAGFVVGLGETHVSHVNAAGVHIGKRGDEPQ